MPFSKAGQAASSKCTVLPRLLSDFSPLGSGCESRGQSQQHPAGPGLGCGPPAVRGWCACSGAGRVGYLGSHGAVGRGGEMLALCSQYLSRGSLRGDCPLQSYQRAPPSAPVLLPSEGPSCPRDPNPQPGGPYPRSCASGSDRQDTEALRGGALCPRLCPGSNPDPNLPLSAGLDMARPRAAPGQK